MFSPYFAILGMGTFVFLTGYTINFNNKILNSYRDFFNFYKKRFFRIYPLYWVSLSMFIAASIYAPYSSNSTIDCNKFNIISHIIGVQILFAPYSVPFPTLWFIGLVCLYYFIYPFIGYYGNNIKYILLISLVIVVISYMAKESLNIIDNRYFLYFFIYLLGIISNRADLLNNRNFTVRYVVIAPLILAMSLILNQRLTGVFDTLNLPNVVESIIEDFEKPD